MRIYYLWQEYFTPAGHAAAALLPLSMVLGMVPGFWAAWIFCGLDFLLFLGMILSLFTACKLNYVSIENVTVAPVYEGDVARVYADVAVGSDDALNASGKRRSAKKLKKIASRKGLLKRLNNERLDSVQLASYRMDPSLKCTSFDFTQISKAQGFKKLECEIKTRNRGAYLLKKVAVDVPEIMGLMKWPFTFQGTVELLVHPRPVKVGEFPFLTAGPSGMSFAPLLMPSISRGLNFIGLREYREGDALRDLHHKAFARYGRPFTKEFEAERGAGAVLVLDTIAPSFAERKHLEPAIRLTAGIALWLLERNILGRFFIDDEEIPLAGHGAALNERRRNLLDALSRIPAANLISAKKPCPWSPAARPMDPVLRVGLFEKEEPLVHKHIVVGRTKNSNEKMLTGSHDILYVDSRFSGGVSL